LSLFALVLVLIGLTLAVGVLGRTRRPGAPTSAIVTVLPTLLLTVLFAALLLGAVQAHRLGGLRVVLEGLSVDIASLKDRPITLGGDPDRDAILADGAPPEAARIGLDAQGHPMLAVTPSEAETGLVTVDGQAGTGDPRPLPTDGRATKLRFYRAEPGAGGEPGRRVEKRSLDVVVRDGRLGLILDTPSVQPISAERLADALDLRRTAGFETVVLGFSGAASGSDAKALSSLPFAALGEAARAELFGRVELGRGRDGFGVTDPHGPRAVGFGRPFALGGDLAALARIDRIDLGWSAYRHLTWLPVAALLLSLVGTWTLRRTSTPGLLLFTLLDLLLLLRLLVAVEAAHVTDASRVTLAVRDALIALTASPFLLAALAPPGLDRRLRLWHGGVVLAALAGFAAAGVWGGDAHGFGRAPSFDEAFGATGLICLALTFAGLLRLLWPEVRRLGAAPIGANPFSDKRVFPHTSSSPGSSGGPRSHPQAVGGLHLGRPDEPGDDEEGVGETPESALPIAPRSAPRDAAPLARIAGMVSTLPTRLRWRTPPRLRLWLGDGDNPWAPIALLAGLGALRIALLLVHVKEAIRLPGARLPLSLVYTPLTLALFAWALVRLGRRAAHPGVLAQAAMIPALWVAWGLALVVAPLAVRDGGYFLTNAGPFLLWAGFAALAASGLAGSWRVALAAPGVLAAAAYLVLALHAQVSAPGPDLIAQASAKPTSPEAHALLRRFAADAGDRLRLEAVFDPEALSNRGSAGAERDRNVIAHRNTYADSWSGRGWLTLERPSLLEKTQLDDDVGEVHLISPFGRTGAAALLAVEGLIAALASLTVLARHGGDVLRLSVGASLGLLCLWTLFFVSAYMLLGVVQLVPFTGRDIYLLAAASPSDLVEGLVLIGLAYALLRREEAAWPA
jgi:hypothetical protein